MRWPPRQKGGNAHQRRARRRFRERMHRRSFEALRALYGPRSVFELVPRRPLLPPRHEDCDCSNCLPHTY